MSRIERMKSGVYNVSIFAEFLRQYKNLDAVVAGFKELIPEQEKRNWFIEKFEKDLSYYGREFKNAFDMSPNQMKVIRVLVYGAKKRVRITHY